MESYWCSYSMQNDNYLHHGYDFLSGLIKKFPVYFIRVTVYSGCIMEKSTMVSGALQSNQLIWKLDRFFHGGYPGF
jgi:hypothetical protein